MTRNTRRTGVRKGGLFTTLAAAIAGALAACSTPRDVSKAGPPAPLVSRQTTTVDVQVFRDETVIRMTNTTAKPLPKGRMWINNWYSRPFDGLGVGKSVELSLADFHDRYGDAFRAGGFFAADRPDTVVLAQIEAGEELIGLIVVGEQR